MRSLKSYQSFTPTTTSHGSSFTEEQEEEREDEEEEMAPEKNVNVKVRNSCQVDFSRQVIRTDSRHKMHSEKNSTRV